MELLFDSCHLSKIVIGQRYGLFDQLKMFEISGKINKFNKYDRFVSYNLLTSGELSSTAYILYFNFLHFKILYGAFSQSNNCSSQCQFSRKIIIKPVEWVISWFKKPIVMSYAWVVSLFGVRKLFSKFHPNPAQIRI